MAVEPGKKRAVAWSMIGIDFKHDADHDALFRALDPPPDVLDNIRTPDIATLEGRLRAWGWAVDPYGTYRSTGLLTTLGIYGDYTWIEDDERFMAVIAPYVRSGSQAVFVVATDDDGVHRPYFPSDIYDGWEFDGTTVVRRTVYRRVEWDFF